MNVRWTVNTDKTILTATWDTIPTAQGFSFWKDDVRVSYTMDGARTTTRFGLDGGTHTFEVRSLGRLDAASTPYPLPAPVPTPVPSAVWWAGPAPPSTATPAVTPTMDDVTTMAGLRALLSAGGTLHGVVRVRGGVYAGNLDIGVRPAARSIVVFEDGVELVGPAASALPAVGVHCANVELYGGNVSNPGGGLNASGGDGVKFYVGSGDTAAVDVRWWGLHVHDTAAGGVSSQGNRFPIHGDVEATATRWGLNVTLDPHTADPGTGIHGFYIGGGATPTTGRWIMRPLDGETGAGVQAGANLQDAELWISGLNLNWRKDRLAGNGFQPWGGNNRNVTVKNLLVDGAQSAIFDESLTSGPVTVEHCRYRNVRLSPAYQQSSHVALPDIEKAV